MPTLPEKQNICNHRHSYALDNKLRRLLQSPKRIVGPYIKPGDLVIDLGCGPGFFTIDMAEMVGPTGKVFAVDLQEEMLDRLATKLFDTDLAKRVIIHQCKKQSIDLNNQIQADFILAFYMVHETPDTKHLFKEAIQVLKKHGRLLLVEPPFHVSKKQFREISLWAKQAGFTILDKPKRKGGRSLLLSR